MMAKMIITIISMCLSLLSVSYYVLKDGLCLLWTVRTPTQDGWLCISRGHLDRRLGTSSEINATRPQGTTPS